ncbi:DUF362 domain-containing protein [bacterium]|nr:DUF362 domain-containing protein [candidate division CSSED10-310 bacterium]
MTRGTFNLAQQTEVLTEDDMKFDKIRRALRNWLFWLMSFGAFLWVVLRSGTNIKRLNYPCQRAALPLAANWVMGILTFLSGSYFLRKSYQYLGIFGIIFLTFWFTGTLPKRTKADLDYERDLPVWEVEDPISKVFIMEDIPATAGSLAAGNETVPDEHLVDPAIDAVFLAMESQGIFIHRTTGHPEGIVASDSVVIIKGNFQWDHQNTTSTDRIKGVIWKILNHPDGFTGEIIVCDNTQEIGTGINENDNNSEDTEQSILDVISAFHAKGYPVYGLCWAYIWDDVVSEYSEGDDNDGYVYEAASKITYPKFLSPSGENRISLRYGIWDGDLGIYDHDRLCIIDFPVLKAHSMAGATIAVKNWIGMLTTAYAQERYGGWYPMHDNYLFGSYALVARVMEVTFPRLAIVDAAWTTRLGPNNLGYLQNTQMIVASTDPVAASWYAAKYILTPIAVYPQDTDPDLPESDYSYNLTSWTNYLRDVAGLPCTKDASEISVYACQTGTSTPTPGQTPTSTETPAPTPTPTVAKTGTPAVPTATQSATPTPPEDPFVLIAMPKNEYVPGDPFSLSVHVHTLNGLIQNPLFVVLDVHGTFFFAPSWNKYDFLPLTKPPGDYEFVIVEEFIWPTGAGSASDILFLAAITDPQVTGLISNLDLVSFGWHE